MFQTTKSTRTKSAKAWTIAEPYLHTNVALPPQIHLKVIGKHLEIYSRYPRKFVLGQQNLDIKIY